MATMKNSLTREDSLPTVDPVRTGTPLKSSISTVSSNLPDILSTAVLHKRRTQKRVRFALKLQPVEEDSLPSSREISDTSETKSNKRVVDPWRQGGSLYGAYIEYLDKQDTLINSQNTENHRTPPPPPPRPPEPGAQPPTYTHTFVIQSKSPELVIDSITVSTPPLHLPRIIHRTKTTNKQPLPVLDSFIKQQSTVSTSPHMIHTRKIINSSNQKSQYASVHAALKRAELQIPSTTGVHPNNKITRPDSLPGSKFFNDHIQTKKMTEVITKPLPGKSNQINHFSERSTLSTYSKKPRIHSHTHRTKDESILNSPYFFHKHNNDHLLQPVIHSNH